MANPIASDIEPLVVVSQKVPLKEKSLSALTEALRSIFRTWKVSKVLYVVGEPLTVEHQVAQKEAPEDSDPPIVTPFQQIRGHAAVSILEATNGPLDTVCSAVQALIDDRVTPTHMVVRNRDEFLKWSGRRIRFHDILQLPLLEDVDTSENRLFVCGSKSGEMIQDIEYAICIRMEN